jgi:hypothetical protein
MLEPEHILHDRYQLKEKLGHNASRQTWLAEDIQTSPPERAIHQTVDKTGQPVQTV